MTWVLLKVGRPEEAPSEHLLEVQQVPGACRSSRGPNVLLQPLRALAHMAYVSTKTHAYTHINKSKFLKSGKSSSVEKGTL